MLSNTYPLLHMKRTCTRCSDGEELCTCSLSQNDGEDASDIEIVFVQDVVSIHHENFLKFF